MKGALTGRVRHATRGNRQSICRLCTQRDCNCVGRHHGMMPAALTRPTQQHQHFYLDPVASTSYAANPRWVKCTYVQRFCPAVHDEFSHGLPCCWPIQDAPAAVACCYIGARHSRQPATSGGTMHTQLLCLDAMAPLPPWHHGQG